MENTNNKPNYSNEFRPELSPYLSYAIQSLAKIECPNFAKAFPNHSSNRIFDFWLEFYGGMSPKAESLDYLTLCVERESKGEVTIVKSSHKNFNVGVLGPASYLALISKDKTQKFLFGPYETPFLFDK